MCCVVCVVRTSVSARPALRLPRGRGVERAGRLRTAVACGGAGAQQGIRLRQVQRQERPGEVSRCGPGRRRHLRRRPLLQGGPGRGQVSKQKRCLPTKCCFFSSPPPCSSRSADKRPSGWGRSSGPGTRGTCTSPRWRGPPWQTATLTRGKPPETAKTKTETETRESRPRWQTAAPRLT